VAAGQSGWRLGTGKKIAVTESKAKAYSKDTAKLWKHIQGEYTGNAMGLAGSARKHDCSRSAMASERAIDYG